MDVQIFQSLKMSWRLLIYSIADGRYKLLPLTSNYLWAMGLTMKLTMWRIAETSGIGIHNRVRHPFWPGKSKLTSDFIFFFICAFYTFSQFYRYFCRGIQIFRQSHQLVMRRSF